MYELFSVWISVQNEMLANYATYHYSSTGEYAIEVDIPHCQEHKPLVHE